MDQTLQTITQSIRKHFPFCKTKRGRSRLFYGIFAAALAMVLGSQTGCQTSKFAKAEIPVPPAVLDKSALDSARFQSPGSNTRDAQPANRVYSLNETNGFQNGSSSKNTSPQPDQANIIAEVNVTGNSSIPTHHLTRNIRTRPGRYFDPDKLQQDVDDLWQMPEVDRINGPYLNRTPEGIIVTIDVEERNTISAVQFIGNRGISDRTLKKEIGLEDGKPLDVHQIRMAKTKLEEYYKDKGYPRTQVEIMEGSETNDSNVVFLIHEDEKQRIWKVEFEGNTIATDARLRHFIQSKPGIMKVFGGLVKRDEIEQDIVRLTTYYRSLGFFNARIGREVDESNDGRWMTVRFIINEGPRYRVRNVSFIGNDVYTPEQLKTMLELKPGKEAGAQPEFNVATMNQDVVALRDLYGSQGFVYSNVEAEPRFLEEPGLLDIVYKIKEGKQYVVGNINVHFEGDYGITKRQVVLNRLQLRPGDLIDSKLLRNSERSLGAAQVFANRQTPGAQPPKIVVRTPEIDELQRSAHGPSGSSFR